MYTDVIYVKASGNCIVYDKNITIGDVLKLECANEAILRQVKRKRLYSFNHEHSIVISILKIIELIHEDYPNVKVDNCGVTDFLVEYQKSTIKNAAWEKLKLILIAIIVFFGSAFTIMTFHIEIGIQKLFSRFYEQVMGAEKPPITELEISYSLGLAIGIVLFFNHFSKKKLTKDPTPIEVEMKKYNQDTLNAKIAEAGEKGHTIDVS